jgi:hypothetical protein
MWNNKYVLFNRKYRVFSSCLTQYSIDIKIIKTFHFLKSLPIIFNF